MVGCSRITSALAAAVAALLSLASPANGLPQAAAAQPQQLNDLDAFMARVLERRDEAWRKLHDYVLDEAEQFRILGPGGVPLHGMKREFTWYVREGFLIRSPVRFDGVSLGDAERRTYEQRWLEQEKEREARAAKKAESAAQAKAEATRDTGAQPGEGTAEPSLQDFVDQRGEPRFISEAYFLRFKFEPGNYYFAGRDTVDGRPVVKIEYYPTRLFNDDRGPGGTRGHHDTGQEDTKKGAGNAGREAGENKREARPDKSGDKERDAEFDRQFNKVALITLWVDPDEHQIVRYTFDNMDFGFLPGRWLVRLDEISASMTMARVLDGVWLPAAIEAHGGLSLASGGYQFQYARRFTNYKKAETGARIRSFVPKDPR